MYATTVASNQVIYTVTKDSGASIVGQLFDTSRYWNPGSSETPCPVTSYNYDNVTDWNSATYTLIFTGPENKTEANIPQDANGCIPITLPDAPGTYQYQFTYNGTALSDPITQTGNLKVSVGKPVHIRLYSNPTTTTKGATVTYYIIASGDPGLPVPTGNVAIVAQWFCGVLDANGTVTCNVTFNTYTFPSTIDILFYGDAEYARTTVSFPLTNPIIPGTTPTPTATPTPTSGGGGTTATPTTGTNATGSGATGAATPSAIAQAATTASVGATNTVTGSATATPAAKTTASSAAGPGNFGGWILGSSILILACLGLFGFRTWRLRKNANKAVIAP